MSSPTPTSDMPPTPVKAPRWRISPANGHYYINSVAVSADGGRVLGGTFYHQYGADEARRGPAAPPATPPSPENGTFGVYAYDAAGAPLWKDEFAGWQGVYWVGISADGSRAAAGGFMSATAPQGFLRAYDATTGRRMLSVATAQRVNQVALSADGTWLVSAAETLRLFRQSGAGADAAYVAADDFKPNHLQGIVSVAISADGSTVVGADFAGQVHLFSNQAGTLALRASWRVPGGAASDFCHMIDLAADGRTFAAGGAGGCFYAFDVAQFIATGQPTARFATGVAGAVYGVAMEGNGHRFAGVVNDGAAGRAYIVLLAGGSAGPARSFALAHNPNSIVLNAAARLAAVADGHPDGTPGCFYLIDLSKGAVRWTCATGNMSWPIAIATNGSAVVGGSDDSHIYYFTP
jgi:WD40 repeat protein